MKIRSKADEPRDVMMTVRLTRAERDQLKQLAAVAGVSVGGYLLGLALGDSIGKAITKDKPHPGQMRLDV